MNNRRIAVAGLAVLAAASLSLTACETTTTPSANASSSAGATPSTPALAPPAALIAAIGKLKGQGYDVKISSGGTESMTGSGSIDPANSSGAVEEKGTVSGQSLDINVIEIGTNLWAKVDLGALSSQLGINPAKWMLVDQTKLTDASSKPFDLSGADAFDVTGLLTSVASVTATDPTHLTGTVDLSAATGIEAPDSDSLTKAGAAAKATPFTATLDDQGRLTDLKITSTVGDLSAEVTFSNYGSPTAITAPAAADVVPAPAGLYQVFNG